MEIPTTRGVELELPPWYSRLRELAYNLWWTWTPSAIRLFHQIDGEHWLHYRNPVELLLNVSPERWGELAEDAAFGDLFRAVIADFDEYLAGAERAWLRRTRPDHEGVIAYFSTEYGWHECLKSYSGGLGVLSGDHTKAASDLGLPLVGVGLLYRRGYFHQTIDFEGNQQHFYHDLDPARLPLRPVVDDEGCEIRVAVDLPGRDVALRVWKVDVGRVAVLLLDTDVEENEPADRRITSILYVQGREMRLCQELVLGIGGVRALDALGIQPSVWHVNEGHSSFLALERMRRILGGGADFDEARTRVARDSLFTTHTPVPAGNETFDLALVQRYLEPWGAVAGVEPARLLQLGREHEDSGQFNLTVLALRTCGRANGVSELHGTVADEMWRHLDGVAAGPEAPADTGEPAEPPRRISHVTNGVHVATWLGAAVRELLVRHLGGDFMLNLQDPGFADAVAAIPDAELWEAHGTQKGWLLRLIRERVREQLARYGHAPDELRGVEALFDRDALTIGFARRFATYKRADLLFQDPERLQAILRDEERPVQVVFAGKAHPADRPGQELIRRICEITHSDPFRGRVVFLEGYQMRLGRSLVQGVDLWLNTPRRPLEASGTSGMKAAVNGGLNCSVLDGWWCEGYDPAHGWAIGDASEGDRQDAEDADALYRVLAEEIVPTYYRRDDSGLPVEWIGRMKTAIGHLVPFTGASRMVREYAERHYFK